MKTNINLDQRGVSQLALVVVIGLLATIRYMEARHNLAKLREISAVVLD